VSTYLHINLHDALRDGEPRLSADAQLFGEENGGTVSVRIASGDAKHCADPSISVFSRDPERMRAIANAFLDAATLLESAKLKPVPGEPGVLIPGPNVCERCGGGGDFGLADGDVTCPDCQGSGTKPKANPLQAPPDQTITHSDGVKAGELPL
jgi:hypothetical protein